MKLFLSILTIAISANAWAKSEDPFPSMPKEFKILESAASSKTVTINLIDLAGPNFKMLSCGNHEAEFRVPDFDNSPVKVMMGTEDYRVLTVKIKVAIESQFTAFVKVTW